MRNALTAAPRIGPRCLKTGGASEGQYQSSPRPFGCVTASEIAALVGNGDLKAGTICV